MLKQIILLIYKDIRETVTSVAFNKTGTTFSKWLLWDNTIKLWNIETKTEIANL